jgi:hypothetical protein
MAIHSTAFGVTRLTHKESTKFRRQVAYGRPSKAAVATLKQGQTLLRALEKNGSVSVKTKHSR